MSISMNWWTALPKHTTFTNWCMLSLIRIYVLPLREKSSSKSGDVRRKMNSSAKQILIGWIYRRIGFLKRGMKKQIKPLAAILRFLDFSIPWYRHFERSQEIFLALRSFLFPSRKVSPFPLSHIRHYPFLQERSLDFARDDVAEVAFSQHILYTGRGLSIPHTVISSKVEKYSSHSTFPCSFRRCILVFCYHTYDIIPSCKKDPSTSLGMTIRE